MSYEITINNQVEIGYPELLVVGNRVRVRIFENRLHMKSGYERGFEIVGRVDFIESEGSEVIARIKADNGKVYNASFDTEDMSFNDDRIVTAA